MIKYYNGKVDNRKVVSVYTWGIYHDLIALMYDSETDTFEELKLRGYWSSGYLDPIDCVVDNLTAIESIEYDRPDLKLLNKFLASDFEQTLENIKEKYNNINGEYQFKKGDMVEVFRGRKYPIGMTFKILAFSEYEISYYNRVLYALTKDTYGKWLKVDCRNIRLVNREELIMNQFTWDKEEVLNAMTSIIIDGDGWDYREYKSKLNK